MYKTLSAPLSVQIEIINACQNKCSHCYNFWRDNDQTCNSGFLTSEQITEIFTKLASVKVFNVTVTGGEPLLNKKGLKTCLEEACEYDIDISMNSSLMPLTRGYLKELRQLGLKSVLTSVLGPNADIHDSITGNSGSFEKTTRNALMVLEEGINLTANMVVSKRNLLFVKETAVLVKSLGIKQFAATKAGCPGNCKDFSALHLSLEEFRQYLEDLHEVRKELDIKIDALESYPLCGIKDIDRLNVSVGRKCLAGVTACTIAVDGQIRPCSHLDVSYGNIFTEDFTEIWEKMSEWRSGELLPTHCKKCDLLLSCGGGCRMEAKMLGGGLNGMDPLSSPKDVEYCTRVKPGRSQVDISPVSAKDFFALNKIKWREESFGAIVSASKKERVYLDLAGANLLKQMGVGKIYQVGDNRLVWGSLKPERFVAVLISKKIVRLVKGGDKNDGTRI